MFDEGWTLYDDFYQSGSSTPVFHASGTNFGNVDPLWTDGMFSSTLSITSGSVRVDPTAQGVVDTSSFTQRIAPLPPTVSVPEPCGSALVPTALALLLWSRRKARR